MQPVISDIKLALSAYSNDEKLYERLAVIVEAELNMDDEQMLDTSNRAYSYRRFSSIEQEQGDSLRRQTELAEKYAADNGLILDTTLSLQDLGVSAFKGDNIERGALGAFVKAIDEGIVPVGSYLLVESLDRISRREVDVALEFFLSITRKGIIIVTLSDGMLYSRESIKANWTTLIISIAIMARAHEESSMKSRRISAAWENKRNNIATKRFTKMCPDWLKPTEEGWEVVEDKAESIRRIYELCGDGYGKASIAKILNEEGYVALSDKGWHPNTVQKMLLTRTVLGEFQSFKGRHPNRVPVGEPVIDYYPRIVDEELWKRAQRPKKVGGGKGFSEMVNVFRRLLKCPKCGGTITIYSSGKDKTLTRHLACYNRYRAMCDSKGRWEYYDFLNSFLRFVSELDLNLLFDNSDNNKNLHNEINALRAEVEAITQKIDNIALSIMDDPSPTLNKLLRTLETSRVTLETELKKVESNLFAAKVPVEVVKRDLDAAIKELETEEQRVKLNSILMQLIEKIELYPIGTGLMLDGWTSPDTTPSYLVTFKNGYTRVVKGENSFKVKLKKS